MFLSGTHRSLVALFRKAKTEVYYNKFRDITKNHTTRSAEKYRVNSVEPNYLSYQINHYTKSTLTASQINPLCRSRNQHFLFFLLLFPFLFLHSAAIHYHSFSSCIFPGSFITRETFFHPGDPLLIPELQLLSKYPTFSFSSYIIPILHSWFISTVFFVVPLILLDNIYTRSDLSYFVGKSWLQSSITAFCKVHKRKATIKRTSFKRIFPLEHTIWHWHFPAFH